jgi:hypothetical protein
LSKLLEITRLSQPNTRARERSERPTGYGLMLLSSLFDDPHSGLVEVLALFVPLILWWTVGRLLVE